MKLYADEVGHEIVRSIDAMAVSCLVRVEVPSALWRKHRKDEIDTDAVQILVRAFEADYFGDDTNGSRFAIVGVDDGILDAAARLVAVHGLRAYDGMQLASALATRAADPECASFACFDDGLRTAAGAEGFSIAL